MEGLAISSQSNIGPIADAQQLACEHQIQFQVLGMVGLAQPRMRLDWTRMSSVTNAGKDREGRGGALPSPSILTFLHTN